MPVIAFANPKGGSGKTTAALLLASELAAKGAAVTVIDADPETWISGWGQIPGKPANLDIISNVTEDSIVDQIEEAARSTQFVIIDLEGTASLMVANAVSMSDLVIIPVQGATMDAKGGAKTIRLIRNQERTSRRRIPFAVLLTRTGAAIRSRALRNVQEQLLRANVDMFTTTLVERAAFKELVDFGGTLKDLDPAQVANIDKALENARQYVGETLAKLKANEQKAQVA
ncbi:MAG: ParA family protein [Gammaproteobacteria bacterium]